MTEQITWKNPNEELPDDDLLVLVIDQDGDPVPALRLDGK